MKKAELAFIPSPGAGHFLSTLEIAKRLVERDDGLSITIIVMSFPHESTTYVDSLSGSASNSSNPIKFIQISNHSLPPLNRRKALDSFIEFQKPRVREAVTHFIRSLSADPDSPRRLVGFVFDMFCTTMIDIADEFGVPSYVFYTSSAAFLGMVFQTQLLYDEQNKPISEFKDSDVDLEIPSLANPFPARFLPSFFLDVEWVMLFSQQARRFRTVKGIIVNSFFELESFAFRSLSGAKNNHKIPPVYPVGPLLNLKDDNYDVGLDGSMSKSEILEWLDHQPESSVVFLCFGSRGCFDQDQVKEIARALEQGGHRFLWSLRQPPPKNKLAFPTNYGNPSAVLPEGFMDRTAKIGKIIGWAPQVSVLGHKAIGGFVSHCGWNSILESVWYGVPIATWPIDGEQNFNAFQIVKDLGIAVEIRMDYRRAVLDENPVLVTAGEIERGIRKLVEDDGEIRKRMKEMSKMSRTASMEGGSSTSALGCFINDLMDNIA